MKKVGNYIFVLTFVLSVLCVCQSCIYSSKNPDDKYVMLAIISKLYYFITGEPQSYDSFLETKGLPGCDTLPLLGDREMIRSTFLDDFHKKISDSTFVYTPIIHPYADLDGKKPKDEMNDSLIIGIPLILYGKNKNIALIFFDIKYVCGEDYYCFVMIGSRQSNDDKFKLYPSREFNTFFVYKKEVTSHTTNFLSKILFDRYAQPFDPEYFEKNEDYRKRPDGTYNYQWIRILGGSEVLSDSLSAAL